MQLFLQVNVLNEDRTGPISAKIAYYIRRETSEPITEQVEAIE